MTLGSGTDVTSPNGSNWAYPDRPTPGVGIRAESVGGEPRNWVVDARTSSVRRGHLGVSAWGDGRRGHGQISVAEFGEPVGVEAVSSVEDER